jgi:hypothetical protein
VADLSFWRLTAGVVAAAFVLIGVFGMVRLTRMAMLVLVLSFLLVPVLGLATYAIYPVPVQDLSVIFLAFPFAGIAFAALLGSFLLRIQAGSSPTFAEVHRRIPLFLVAWPSLVAAVSVFVYLFEPAFAVANAAVTAAWFLLWVPRVTRRSDRESSYEIAATPDRVYAFVTEAANWPLYNPGVESVTVQPPGPIAVGSRITFRQRVAYPGLRGPRLMLPSTLDLTSEVTALDTDRLLATRRVDLPDSSDVVELTSLAGGRTLVTGRAHNVLPYRYAVVGARVSALLSRESLQKLVAERQAKLKHLLEQP